MCAARCGAWSGAKPKRTSAPTRSARPKSGPKPKNANAASAAAGPAPSGVSKYYPYMLTIAGMFFLSIMVMFWSLHLDMRYTRLERDVQKLRERSIRLQEQRYQRTTHSAIVEQLRARGIELYDPQAPGEIIEN